MQVIIVRKYVNRIRTALAVILPVLKRLSNNK